MNFGYCFNVSGLQRRFKVARSRICVFYNGTEIEGPYGTFACRGQYGQDNGHRGSG